MKKVFHVLLCLFFVFILWFGELNIDFSKQALILWFENLVPSMFCIMVLVKVLFAQGIFTLVGTWLGFFTQRIFNMDAMSFSYVLVSMFLGFPAQAAFINTQVEQHHLSKKQGQRLLCCCSFATPGFVILTCGGLLFHSTLIGVKLFLIQLLSGLCLLGCTRKTRITSTSNITYKQTDFMTSLKEAILESGVTLYLIGGYLMLFMSVSGLLVQFLPNELQPFFRILAEFSSGSFILFEQPLSASMFLLCLNMLLSFGGFCVHMQVMGMSKDVQLPYRTYFFYRLLQASLACLITLLFLSMHWL